MDLATLQRQRRFLVRQKLTMMVNRYVVSIPDAAGNEGATVAFVEQKRMAWKEQVRFFADETRQRELFQFKARSVMDVAATYDVTAPDGSAIGLFRKDFGRSLLRSTWHVEQPGHPRGVGHERNMLVAVLRRIWELIPFVDLVPFAWPYHFDFATPDGPLVSVEKRFGLRDRYVVDVHDDGVDRRLVIAQAVALDALQSR